MAEEPKLGAVLELGDRLRSMTRRRFIQTLGVTGASITSLAGMIETVYGQKPEGIPIIHTYDIYGNPDKVRLISDERYRRLSVYTNLPSEFMEQHPQVRSVGIKQISNDEDDLALELFVNKLTSSVRSQLPDTYRNVPVVYTEEPAQAYPDYCPARHDRRIVRGGLAIGPGDGGRGTLTVVGFDKGSNNRAFLTADHVMDGHRRMWQPNRNYSDARRVGSYSARSIPNQGQDVTKYKSGSNVESYLRVTQRGDVPDITGSWEFFGLADRLYNTGPLKSYLSGANHCRVVNYCEHTRRFGARAAYQANYQYRRCGGGDSGGPYVNGNGKLVTVHSGYVDAGGRHDVGGVGKQSLDAVGMKLYE